MLNTVSRILVIAVFAVAAFGGVNPTTELLRARPAQKFIRIGFVPDAVNSDKFSLQYGVDDFSDLDPLTDGIVLRTDAGADVYLAYYNPLSQSFEIGEESVPDASFASLKAIFEDLQKAQANIAGPAAGVAGARDIAQPIDACDELTNMVNRLHRSLKTPELTAARLKNIVDGASGYEGVKTAAHDLADIRDNLDTNIETAEKALKALRTDFTSFAGGRPTSDCFGQQVPAGVAEAKALLKRQETARAAADWFKSVSPDADDIIAKKKALRDSLDALLKSLDPFLVRARWRGADIAQDASLTDYDWNHKIAPDFLNERKVTVTARAKDVVLEKDVIVTRDLESTKKTAQFRMRQDSLFVPERAAAVIYDRLKFPKYSAKKNDAGKTVVTKTEDEDPWNAAMLLNLVMHTSRPSVFSPMLQLGVSTAKNFPGLIAGAGLRFTEPVAFGISFGGMITRYKDLDSKLHENDEVADDDEIAKHLQDRWSPVVPYIAFQMKF